jgi:hypothetical protein
MSWAILGWPRHAARQSTRHASVQTDCARARAGARMSNIRLAKARSRSRRPPRTRPDRPVTLSLTRRGCADYAGHGRETETRSSSRAAQRQPHAHPPDRPAELITHRAMHLMAGSAASGSGTRRAADTCRAPYTRAGAPPHQEHGAGPCATLGAPRVAILVRAAAMRTPWKQRRTLKLETGMSAIPIVCFLK